MRRVVSNFLVFQAGWFACVLCGAGSRPYLAVPVAIVIAAWHLSRAPRPQAELATMAAVTVSGVILDSLFAASGWLSYASPVPWPAFAPVWIVALWVCFSTTLNVSLRWLRAYPVIAASLGLAGGPLAYLAGEALGGVTFVAPVQATIALAAGWALIMPLVLRVAARFDGWSTEPAQALARESA